MKVWIHNEGKQVALFVLVYLWLGYIMCKHPIFGVSQNEGHWYRRLAYDLWPTSSCGGGGGACSSAGGVAWVTGCSCGGWARSSWDPAAEENTKIHKFSLKKIFNFILVDLLYYLILSSHSYVSFVWRPKLHFGKRKSKTVYAFLVCFGEWLMLICQTFWEKWTEI